jgi:hypothetical protein
MGSRAVVLVCRDPEGTAGERRFGVPTGGQIWTRTGRAFLDGLTVPGVPAEHGAVTRAVLDRLRAAAESAGLFTELAATASAAGAGDWLLLDCELLPWSAKAEGLLRGQYAPTGAAGQVGLGAALAALRSAEAPADELAPLLARFEERGESVDRYIEAYHRYIWPVRSLDDLRIAPFHLLASEGAVHIDKDHLWQMATLADLCAADPALLKTTPYRVVDVSDADSVALATAWWEELTSAGGEGMVVKPLAFVARSGRGLVQPGVKVRGREYLRIVYGPEYTRAENVERLRQRSLGRKRQLALSEFALGVEALERFVARAPFHRVHECVFAILALESEPVDPRL